MMRWLPAVVASLVATPAFAQAPLHVFLRGGPKTHGPGEHEHELFVGEWTKLLSARGAVVEGALRFPTADELARADVLVMYAADGGSILGEDRAHLETFVARGGGIVALHDAVCGDDPPWFKTVIGGAWEHGHSKWLEGTTDLYFTDVESPVTRGAANFRFEDELYFDLHVMPDVKVLAQGFHSVFDITPQTWTYEKDRYRAFVSIQGHEWTSFSHPAWRALLLRGIAWAGKRDADLLLKPGEAEALRYPPGGPTAPERAHELIDVHPDFDLSLAAAEPVVVKPISIDWDLRGRMWVAMTPGYPEKERFSGVEAHDEIAILADRDGDGRMDERATFAGGLDLVTSFVFHRDGVIASAAPDILWLRDTDGDDVCDARQIVFTGFGFGDTHAVVSSLRWGLDGWIYATQGYSGNDSTHVRNAAGRDFGKIGNGLFRFRPDGSAIEMVSSFGSNTWGCSFSPEGELFFTMANGAHLRHVVAPERYLEGNRVDGAQSWTDVADHDRVVPLVAHADAPYAQIDFVGGFTAASGSCFYDGGAWPREWSSSHFVCEPTVHIVHHDVVEPNGVTFVARKAREEEFIAGRDLWFRPVDVRVGPDGALYVLDFYNQAVVHNDTRGPKHGPTNAAIRPDRDHELGRIWRVQHGSAKPASVALPLSEDTAERVGLLGHPNAWVRRTAQRALVERANPGTRPAIRRAVEEASSPALKAHAAWCLAELGFFDANAADWLSDKSAAWVRRAFVEIARSLPPNDRTIATDRIAVHAHSPEPRLALAAWTALGQRDLTPGVWNVLWNTWPRMRDDWTRSVAVRCVARDLTALVRSIGNSSESPKYADLARYAAQKALRGASDLDLQRLVAVLATADVDDSVRCAVLEVVVAESKPPAPGANMVAAREAVKRLLASPDERVALAAMPLAARWGLEGDLAGPLRALAERLRAQISDARAFPQTRVRALRALLALPPHRTAAIEASMSLLGASAEPEEQVAVLDALATTDDAAAAAAIADSWPALAPEARERAFEALAARAAWTNALLDRLESGALAMDDLGPQRLHRLRNHPDPATSQRAVRVLAALGAAANAQVDELVARLLPLVDAPGDRERGREVFRQNCSTCHAAFGEGASVGPDLSGMGAHGARDLLAVILDPNRSVEASYAEWIVTTDDERHFAGVLVRESADSVLLRSSSGDAEVPRDEIAEMRNTGRSPMPAGFETLVAEALRDVIAFLAGDTAGYRLLDLRPHATASTLAGLYDRVRDAQPMRFRAYGVQKVRGVPFEILDPRRALSGCNALVLKGGIVPDWDSKTKMPQRVEVSVGCELASVHVLGGIAAWGYPYFKEEDPILRWTWRFADGSSEEFVLRNGVEFADWIRRHDVPVSEFVDGLLTEDSTGQVRYFEIRPAKRGVVASIALESYDNRFAPTILALTAELPFAPEPQVAATKPHDVVIVGGGSSHDFGRHYRDRDRATLRAAGIASTHYVESPADLLAALANAKVLVLANNRELPGRELRDAIFGFVERGGGLVILHAASWFNWADWPEYNERLVGGGARSHETYGKFEVRVVARDHPVTVDVPTTFEIEDELYRLELSAAAEREVLAIGRSLSSGDEFPVAWARSLGQGKIVGLTLGHDQAAHGHAAYQKLLVNAVKWVMQR